MNKYDIDYDFETIDGTEKLVVLIGNPDGDIKLPDNPNSRTIDSHPCDPNSNPHKDHFHLTVVVEENPTGYNSMNPLRLLSEKYIKSTEKTKTPQYLTIYCVSNENPNVIKRKRRTRTTVSDGIKDD